MGDKYTNITLTAGRVCHHANGWYFTAKIWWMKKRYFVCSDCGKGLTERELAELKKEGD